MMMSSAEARSVMAAVWASGGQAARSLQRRVVSAVLAPLALGELLETAARVLGGSREDGMYVYGPQDRTLCDVVRYYLDEDPDASTAHQRMLRHALRMWFSLPGTCARESIYAACTGTPVAALHDLPDRIHSRAYAIGKSAAHAGSFRSAIRAAMAAAAAQGVVGIAIPVEWIDLETEEDAASDVTGRLILALADLWASGETPTREAIHARGGVNPGSSERRLVRWAAEGLVEWRHTHRGREIAAVDLTGQAAVTGRTVLQAFCDQRPFSDVRHRQVMGSIRAYLGLPERWRMREDEIIEGAAALRPQDLQGLPDAIQRTAERAGKASKSARDWASAVRAMLRWAAAHRLVPMIWRDRVAGEWDHARDEWIPGGTDIRDRVSGATRAAHRSAWQWLREAVQDVHGPEITPDDLTEAHILEARDWLRRRGRYDHAGNISAAANFAGRRGYGPRAGLQPVATLLLPVSDSKSYGAFLSALDDHLGAEWREMFEWLGRWHTATHRELALAGMPERPPARELSEGTLIGRAKAVRWILGLMVHLDGWVSRREADPSTTRHSDEAEDSRAPCPANCLCRLTPAVVFGRRATVGTHTVGLERAVALGEQLWVERYEAGELASPVGSSIQGYVNGAGLVAEAIYTRLRHERGKEIARLSGDAAAKKPRWGIDPVAEEGATKNSIEESLWQAYQLSRRVAARLKRAARNYGDSEGPNTAKDIRRIVQQTSYGWFTRVLDEYHRLARHSLEIDGNSREHHELIRDSFLLGLLVSTLIRGEEAVHLRCDVQLPPEALDPEYDGPIRIQLRAIDRKNSTRLTVQLFPTLVPAWLRTAYLLESRPWLMAAGQHAHQHLLVDNAGRAYGCPAEKPDGRGRDSKKIIEKRVGALRTLWQNRVGRVAWEHCGLECPTRDGDFTLHVVRNAGGAAIYASRGATATAHALGDSEASIRDHYGFLDGDSLTADIMRDAAAVGQYTGTNGGETPARTDAMDGETIRARLTLEGLPAELIARVLTGVT
jgi:hypothetical protein